MQKHLNTINSGVRSGRKFLYRKLLKLFIENKRWQVPLLMGHTSSEFIAAPVVKSKEEFKDMAVELFGEDADEFLEICGFNDSSLDDIVKKASVNSIEYGIRVAAQANFNTGSKVPVYYYNFDAEIPGWDNPGAFHSVDLWFTFETLAKCWRPFVGKTRIRHPKCATRATIKSETRTERIQ